MTTLKIETSIDLTNQVHMAAAIAFMQIIGGTAVTQEAPAETPKKETAPKKSAELPKKETAKKEEAPAEEPKKEEKAAPAKTEGTSTIKIEEVRALLAKKVNDHRDAVKAKLTELGASSVTTLESDNYPAFIEFLNSL